MDYHYTDLNQLPLTLSANKLASVLGISRASAYCLMHSKGFPTLVIGKRMMVHKEQLLLWMNRQLSAGAEPSKAETP